MTDAGAKLAQQNLDGKTGEAVGNQLRANSERVSDAATANAPKLTMERLDGAISDEEAKAPLMDGDVKAGGRLVLVVIKPHAVDPIIGEDGTPRYESFDLFIRPKLDTDVHADGRVDCSRRHHRCAPRGGERGSGALDGVDARRRAAGASRHARG